MNERERTNNKKFDDGMGLPGLLVRAKKKAQRQWGTRYYIVNWIATDFGTCRLTRMDGSRVDGSYDITDFKLVARYIEIPVRTGTQANRQ